MKQKESKELMQVATHQIALGAVMICLTLTGCSRSPATPANSVLGSYEISERSVPVDYLGEMTFTEHGKKLDVKYQRQMLTCSSQQRFVAIHLRRDGQNKQPDDPTKHGVLIDGISRYYALGVKFGSYNASSDSPFYGYFAYQRGGKTFPIGDNFDPAQYKGVTIAAENPTKSSDAYILFKVPSDLRECKYTDSLTTCDITLAGKTDAPAIQHSSPQNSSAAGSVARGTSDTSEIAASWLTEAERKILDSFLSHLKDDSVRIQPVYERAVTTNADPVAMELAAKWSKRLGKSSLPSEVAVVFGAEKPDAQTRFFKIDTTKKLIQETTPNVAQRSWQIDVHGATIQLPSDLRQEEAEPTTAPSSDSAKPAPDVSQEIADGSASARGGTNTNAVSKVPKLRQPDESIVLPDSAKKESEEAFAKGYTYFIWPAKEGPFKVDSGLLSIPFFCIAKDKAQPYAAACQVFTMDFGSPKTDAGFQVMKLDGMTYSSRGKGEVLYIDVARNHLGRGSATVHLVDFETTTKQISNDMTVRIAGVIPQI